MSLLQPRCALASHALGRFTPDMCQRCGATNAAQCADDEAHDAQIATAPPWQELDGYQVVVRP